MAIRPTTPADAAALAEIYADAVLHGLGTFEEEPPSPAEMEARRARVTAFGLPHLVAEDAGRVLGFAYAAPFRMRPAYRYTAEDTVYVHPDAKGRGVGRELLAGVIGGCEARGLRQLLALVGDSGNTASIALHEAGGLHNAPACCPRWATSTAGGSNVVWLQRALGSGSGRRTSKVMDCTWASPDHALSNREEVRSLASPPAAITTFMLLSAQPCVDQPLTWCSNKHEMIGIPITTLGVIPWKTSPTS